MKARNSYSMQSKTDPHPYNSNSKLQQKQKQTSFSKRLQPGLALSQISRYHRERELQHTLPSSNSSTSISLCSSLQWFTNPRDPLSSLLDLEYDNSIQLRTFQYFIQAQQYHPLDNVRLATVCDRNHRIVDIGIAPSDWQNGTANRVLHGEWEARELYVNVYDSHLHLPPSVASAAHDTFENDPVVFDHSKTEDESLTKIPDNGLPKSFPNLSDDLNTANSLTSTEPANTTSDLTLPSHIGTSPVDEVKEIPANQFPDEPVVKPLSTPRNLSAATTISHSAPPFRSIHTLCSLGPADIRLMNGLSFGVNALQGARPSMEDKYTILENYDKIIHQVSTCRPARNSSSTIYPAVYPATESSTNDGPACYSFVAVYDGHCGDEAAEYLRQHLHINVAKHMPWPLPADSPFPSSSTINMSPTHKGATPFPLNNWDPHESILSFSTQVQEAMKLGAHETEMALLEESQKNQWRAGCVSAIAIISGRQLYIGHAGDCRAVMCSAGQTFPLTQDHRPSLIDETERILSAGGNVSHGCLGGFLAVSRAFGDYDPQIQSKIPGLSAMLHVDKVYLTDEDEFMVIASDGLWDAMTNAEVSGFTRSILSRDPDQSVQYAAQKLVAEAVRRNSDDNVTAVVIGFGKVPERTENDQAPDPIIIQRRKSVMPIPIQRRSSVLQSSPHRTSNAPHPLSSPSFRLNSPRTQSLRLAGIPPIVSFTLRDNDHLRPLHSSQSQSHSHVPSATSTSVESTGTSSSASSTASSSGPSQRPRFDTGFLLSLLQNSS